jgi:hypothetical protein
MPVDDRLSVIAGINFQSQQAQLLSSLILVLSRALLMFKIFWI